MTSGNPGAIGHRTRLGTGHDNWPKRCPAAIGLTLVQRLMAGTAHSAGSPTADIGHSGDRAGRHPFWLEANSKSRPTTAAEHIDGWLVPARRSRWPRAALGPLTCPSARHRRGAGVHPVVDKRSWVPFNAVPGRGTGPAVMCTLPVAAEVDSGTSPLGIAARRTNPPKDYELGIGLNPESEAAHAHGERSGLWRCGAMRRRTCLHRVTSGRSWPGF